MEPVTPDEPQDPKEPSEPRETSEPREPRETAEQPAHPRDARHMAGHALARTKAYFLSYTKEDLIYLAVALFATAPAWIVRYPPIEDLPFHLATIRVVHDLNTARYGFAEHFYLTLGRTQYVLYYIVGSVLSYVTGVVGANVVLMGGYLGGTVLALRNLLQALNKDQRLSLLAIPLLYNVMFLFGLLPFLLGIPIMFWALATAVRWFEAPTKNRGILLCILAISLFYSHIFPFGIFGIGVTLMFPWREPRKWVKAATPFVPALLVLGWWLFFTEAGRLVLGTLTDRGAQDRPAPLNQAIPGAYNWLLDIFKDQSDDVVLAGFFVAILFVTALAQGEGRKDEVKPAARMYALLPIVCLFLYFNTGEGHGYIWLISQRFPILFLLTLIPVLRMPTATRGWIGTAALAGLAIYSTTNVCKHFIKFQLDEVGDIDGAIDSMEPGKKVAALIYDKNSSVTNWAPFLHFGSYYQLKKGGVVEFTYAGYAHWPFDFKPGKYPPPGGPARKRWEWTPESVPVRGELYPYYDYVLTRGPGFNPPGGTFHQTFRGDKWTVWKRDSQAGPNGSDAPSNPAD